MRSDPHARSARDPAAAPRPRRPFRSPEDLAGSEHIEMIRFDWKIKTGVQPVILVTRRRLD